VAFYHERVAFYHEEKPLLASLPDFGILTHLWLFIMNGRLFIIKKDRFWQFYPISAF